MELLGVIALFAVLLGLTAWQFRRGGIYNPVDDVIEPLNEPESLPIPPIEETTVTETKTPPEPVYEPTEPSLDELCISMRNFEGKPGDANYKNNNPLNCRFYDPKQTGTDSAYLPIYRPVIKTPGGFAKFKDAETGWLYGRNMIKNKIKNHPNWTLLDLVSDHAPPGPPDYNPTLRYAQAVARDLGVDITYKVKNLA